MTIRFSYLVTVGAIAIDPSPSRNKMNMAGISLREAGGALENSSQMKTRQ
jgi:hypothetical protein